MLEVQRPQVQRYSMLAWEWLRRWLGISSMNPRVKQATQHFQSLHLDLLVKEAWVKEEVGGRTYVVIVYEVPGRHSRPAPYKVITVEKGGRYSEVDLEAHPQFRVRGRK